MNIKELQSWEGRQITLRELRKWHMAQVYKFKQKTNAKTASRFTKETYALKHNFHLKCVQALNECFPVGDNDHL